MTRSQGLFLVRVAGLQAAAIENFGRPELTERVSALLRLENEVKDLRSTLVDQLHEAIAGAPRTTRHALLGAKRDAFNGRTIRLPHSHAAWKRSPAALETARRIEKFEVEMRQREDELHTAVHAARWTERRHLLVQLRDRELRRGITLSSPDWWSASDRLRALPPERWGRKERSLEQTLLRFVSRAALKLSPFSTFTQLGLGQTVTGSERPVRLVGREWSRRSLLRVKRFLLDQALELAIHHPRVRDPLVVMVNETLTRVGPDRHRLIRPGSWKFDEERGELRYFIDAAATVHIDDTWLAWLGDRLNGGNTRWCELVASLAASEGEEAPSVEARTRVEESLAPWLSTGLLQLLWPWPSNTIHLEDELLAFLAGLPAEPDIVRFKDVVERLVELEGAWADTEDGGPLLREIDRRLVELRTCAAGLAGLDADRVSCAVSPKGNYYEDVFIADCSRNGLDGAVFEAPRESLDAAFADMEPEVRLAYLYNERHDFLPSLAHLMQQEWPAGGPVPLLEVFRRTQPLWQELRRYRRATRGARGLTDSFNPHELPGIAALAEHKKRLWAEAADWIVEDAGQIRIDGDALLARLEDLPPGYRPAIGACLLLQPLDPRGARWVLNRMYEGVGRYSSRFSGAMEEPERRRYAEHLAARGRVSCEGEPAELLDLVRPQGDILNVHALQTPLALDFPGERCDAPADRRRSLDQLYLSVHPRPGLFPGLATVRVTDHQGRRLLPVHLGGTAPFLMPTLIKFLISFGVGEILPVYPSRPLRREGEVRVRDRLVIGRVVLQRKRWVFSKDQVPPLFDLPEDKVYLMWNRWRMGHELPERLFVQEATSHFVLPDRYKPQYVDFSSPSFVSLLTATAKRTDATLVFDEALPDIPDLPPDVGHGRRAVELQVDHLAFERATAFTGHAGPSSKTPLHGRFVVAAGSAPAGHPTLRAQRARATGGAFHD